MDNIIKNLIRPHFLEMRGYVSAGMESDKSANTVFLNANENPYELPGLEGFNRYPEPQPKALLEGYAALYDVKPENITATRGADEAIVILTRLFCEPIPSCHPRESGDLEYAGTRSPIQSGTQNGDAILVCPPTFGMYGVNGLAAPVDVVESPLIKQDGKFTLDVENIKAALSSSSRWHEEHSDEFAQTGSTKDGEETSPTYGSPPSKLSAARRGDDGGRIKMVFLCSPNNPTGNCFPREDLVEVINAAKGKAIVILDETYIEFAEAESLTNILAENPHLIILRTLSKSYSMAGMRMGCMLNGDPEFISLVRSKAMDAYPLPRASVAAALKVIEPAIQEIALSNIKKLLAERDRLIPLLEASEHITHIYPSDTNFLLIEMKDAKKFCDFTKRNGVTIRDFSDKAGTENCIRLSIGLPEENEMVLELLGEFRP